MPYGNRLLEIYRSAIVFFWAGGVLKGYHSEPGYCIASYNLQTNVLFFSFHYYRGNYSTLKALYLRFLLHSVDPRISAAIQRRTNSERHLDALLEDTAVFPLDPHTVLALVVSCPRDTQVSGYSEDGDNFNNFGGALLSLFVLVTEENFPMVADPSFTQRPLVRTKDRTILLLVSSVLRSAVGDGLVCCDLTFAIHVDKEVVCDDRIHFPLPRVSHPTCGILYP